MKERPIIFNTEMVLAILEGRKTQTRRIIKPQPDLHKRRHRYAYVVNDGVLEYGRAPWRKTDPNNFLVEKKLRCPYGQTGDRLWVRETWKPTGIFWDKRPSDTRCGARFAYKADYERLKRDALIKWRTPIHMPRWASRITLEIRNIKVERLQDITEEDARAEGVSTNPYYMADGSPDEAMSIPAKGNFMMLWDSINAKRGFGWDLNPWVWVLDFKRA